MKRRTSKLMLAATTAKPNSMKIKLRITYPGLLESAWSFCKAKHSFVPVLLWRTKELVGKLSIYLKSDIITESYSREGHEAIVEAIEVAPTLVFREYRSTRRDNYARQQTGRQHEIHLCSFGLLTSEIRLRLPDHDRRDFIQSFADALEHDQP